MPVLNLRIQLPIAFILFSLWIIVFTYYSITDKEVTMYQHIDAQLEDSANLVPLLLNENFHKKDMSRNDLTKSEDMKNIINLSEYTDTTSTIYIYSLIKRNNAILFTSSSATKEELKSDKGLSYYFDSYEDVDPRVFDVFQNKEKAFIEYTDKWGAFRSVFIPRTAKDGSTYIVAADISIKKIQEVITKHTYHSLLISFLFILFSIPLYIVSAKNTRRITHEKLKHESTISQLHKIEQHETELMAAIKDAKKANLAKSEFLSHMSHEFRTPLNAILGFSQLLEMDIDKSKKEQSDSIVEIMKAGKHLLNIIDDILDTSKIESGKLDVDIENIQLNDLVAQSVSLIKHQADIKEISIINNISDNKYNVEADGHRLRQVLLNLLSNAIKYNSEKGTITLDAEIINQQSLRVKITDTGQGLNEEEIKRLYIPFERLNPKKSIDGTGLGLVITKSLVELMNGKIGVESKIGEGTTFWIELKLIRE